MCVVELLLMADVHKVKNSSYTIRTEMVSLNGTMSSSAE